MKATGLVTCAFLVICLTFSAVPVSHATVFIATESRSFRPDTTIDDDILLAGNYIKFQSDVTGDLFGASQQLVFSGTSQGSVNWAARNIIINGPVDRSLRVFAQSVDLNSPVGGNVIAMAQSIILGPATRVARDAALFASEIDVDGEITGDLLVDGHSVSVGGNVGGSATVKADKLQIKPTTVINGDFFYESPEQIKIEDTVVIKGETRWKQIKAEAEQKKYNAFAPIKFPVMMYLVMSVVFSLVVFLATLLLGNAIVIPFMFLALIASGLVVVFLNKNMAVKATNAIRRRFFASLGLGLLLMLLTPVAIIIAMITVIGIPIGMLMLFALGVFSFAGGIYSAQLAGSFICRFLGIKRNPPSALCLIIGTIVLAAIVLIPYVGWPVLVVAMTLGLGATVLALDIFQGKEFLAESERAETPDAQNQ